MNFEEHAAKPLLRVAGIATPKSEMDLIRQRLKLLRSEVKNAKEKSS